MPKFKFLYAHLLTESDEQEFMVYIYMQSERGREENKHLHISMTFQGHD